MDNEIKSAAETARETIDALCRSCETAIRALDAGKYHRVGPGEFQDAMRVIAAVAVLQERVRRKEDAR